MVENKMLTDEDLEGIVGGIAANYTDLPPAIQFNCTCNDCGFSFDGDALEYNEELLRYMVGGCCPVCHSTKLEFKKLK